ncbi:MAG: radical SAM protein [Thermoleophilia bacterium]|nr:radical SAM protein [Thermoleophilia bacterium]
MPMSLTAIHFLVTYRCIYACDHCFVFGGPETEGTMTLAQLNDAIDQTADVPSIDTVYFEGGEPTLYWPVVLEAARYARARGLDVGVVTNCHWAESVEDAKVWLAPLAEIGITDLSLSSYAYFAEEENLEERLLRNAVLAAVELGLPMGLLEVGAEAKLDVPGVCTGDVGEIMYKGRAAVELAPARAELDGRPPQTFTECPYEDFVASGRAHLGADGELQLCQGISAGNVWRDGLAAVVERYDPRALPVVRELLRGGPLELTRAYDVVPARERYADACHLCFETRLALRDRYPDVLAPAACYGPAGA